MNNNEILIPQAKMPDECYKCPCFGKENGDCQIDGEFHDAYLDGIGNLPYPDNCPLRTIEEHDKELKTKIYADLYSIAVRAERQGGHIAADYIKVKALQEGIEL